MIRSILMGAVAGARSMTPLAVVTDAARRGALPADNGAPALLAHPLASAGAAALAAGELWGDKLKSAPDRIVIAGLAARLASAGIAGMALAPRRHRIAGGALAAATAIVSSYITFNARMRAIDRYGQTGTGAVEDAIAVASAVAIANVPDADQADSARAKPSG